MPAQNCISKGSCWNISDVHSNLLNQDSGLEETADCIDLPVTSVLSLAPLFSQICSVAKYCHLPKIYVKCLFLSINAAGALNPRLIISCAVNCSVFLPLPSFRPSGILQLTTLVLSTIMIMTPMLVPRLFLFYWHFIFILLSALLYLFLLLFLCYSCALQT